MSTTPRTDNIEANLGITGQNGEKFVPSFYCRQLEHEVVNLRTELESLRSDFQANCPHEEWEKIDGRFDTDRGVGGSCYQQCPVCGKIRDHCDGPFPEDDDEPRISQEDDNPALFP